MRLVRVHGGRCLSGAVHGLEVAVRMQPHRCRPKQRRSVIAPNTPPLPQGASVLSLLFGPRYVCSGSMVMTVIV